LPLCRPFLPEVFREISERSRNGVSAVRSVSNHAVSLRLTLDDDDEEYGQ
jgi:hypothetical protein